MARIDRRRSWSYFTEALTSNITEIEGGTTPEGIHLGAMAGIDDLALSCYAGIETWGVTIAFDTCLPDELPGLPLRLRYRSCWLTPDLSHERLKLSIDRDERGPFPVTIRGMKHLLQPGIVQDFRI